MSTSTSATQVVPRTGERASGRGSRRFLTILAALICVAAANVYFLKGAEIAKPGSVATGWSFFQLEAAPPPIYATGAVRSGRSARISPPVAGIVSRVVPDKFAQVHTGEVLIELDRRQALAALDQERVALDTAKVEESAAHQYLDYLEAQA